MKNKRCKACKHRTAEKSRFEMLDGKWCTNTWACCMHKKAVFTNSIGEVVFSLCETMRQEGRPCGPEAILWEAKSNEE